MAKRLQVILKDPEYREIQRVARSRHMSIAEWVRQALDLARRREPAGSVGKKLEVIRAAARHDYPVSDIDGMLAEIERGYGTGEHPCFWSTRIFRCIWLALLMRTRATRSDCSKGWLASESAWLRMPRFSRRSCTATSP